jgi:hypothetical protein
VGKTPSDSRTDSHPRHAVGASPPAS